MDVVSFKDLTTEDHLKKLEVEAEKYSGLYVDMDDKDQRIYVKDQAATITKLIKKINRARIDKSAEFKSNITAEADHVIGRLEKANERFTLLLVEYKGRRDKVLQAEKDRIKSIEDAQQLESDHELALLQYEKHKMDGAERARGEAERLSLEESARIEREKRIAEQAAENSRLAEIARRNTEELKVRREREARQADHEPRRSVNCQVLAALKGAGITEEQAKSVIKVILSGHYPVTINY